jgi:hypothetical protein
LRLTEGHDFTAHQISASQLLAGHNEPSHTT